MKSFNPKAWLLPQPVLIIGTYNADGTPNAMNAAWGGPMGRHRNHDLARRARHH